MSDVSPSKPLLKYEELAAALRKKVLTLSSGSRLPSVRSLMKRYQVSLQTVNAALNILEKESLIITRQGSGTYVSDHRQVRLVALHRSRHASIFEDAKEECLRRAITKAGWHLETRRHNILSDEVEINLTPEAKACAHIVSQDVAHLRGQLISQLSQQEVPVVIIARESGPLELDYLTTNDRLILNHLIKHLLGLGHRRFGLLVNEPSVYYEISERIRSFREILDLMDLPPGVVIDCGTEPGEKSSHAGHAGMLQYFSSLGGGPLPFTALLVNSAAGGIGALRAFHEAGISVPNDCSVASHGSEEANLLTIPSLTDAGTPIELWGEWTVNILEKRFRDNPAQPMGYQLPVSLYARESTGPAPTKDVLFDPVKPEAVDAAWAAVNDRSSRAVVSADRPLHTVDVTELASADVAA